MIESLKHIDLYLFKLIHLGMSNSFFDLIMPLLRIPFLWAPVYLFLLVWMWQQFGYKGLLWCGFFFITFMFCDYISASVIKKLVMRIRPCNDAALTSIIHHLVPCGKGYSFPSTHAANHFGLSFFMIFTLKGKFKYLGLLAIGWATVISFAQVYVGVHYPFDILCGALLGIGISKLLALYFHRRVTLTR